MVTLSNFMHTLIFSKHRRSIEGGARPFPHRLFVGMEPAPLWKTSAAWAH